MNAQPAVNPGVSLPESPPVAAAEARAVAPLLVSGLEVIARSRLLTVAADALPVEVAALLSSAQISVVGWGSATNEVDAMTGADARPIVLVTGAAGDLGRSVAAALADGYRIVGLDRKTPEEGGAGASRGRPITTALTLIDRSITAWRIDHTLEPDRLAATSDHDAAGEGRGEDANFSVAGEEDPDAALDLVDPTTEGPEANCPWPRERSA
jgi:hypothetical protein